MVKLPKIVIAGAGSALFGLACIRDAFTTRELFGSELVLVDIDAGAVERMAQAAEKINRKLRAGYKITKATDRREALKSAD